MAAKNQNGKFFDFYFNRDAENKDRERARVASAIKPRTDTDGSPVPAYTSRTLAPTTDPRVDLNARPVDRSRFARIKKWPRASDGVEPGEVDTTLSDAREPPAPVQFQTLNVPTRTASPPRAPPPRQPSPPPPPPAPRGWEMAQSLHLGENTPNPKMNKSTTPHRPTTSDEQGFIVSNMMSLNDGHPVPRTKTSKPNKPKHFKAALGKGKKGDPSIPLMFSRKKGLAASTPMAMNLSKHMGPSMEREEEPSCWLMTGDEFEGPGHQGFSASIMCEAIPGGKPIASAPPGKSGAPASNLMLGFCDIDAVDTENGGMVSAGCIFVGDDGYQGGRRGGPKGNFVSSIDMNTNNGQVNIQSAPKEVRVDPVGPMMSAMHGSHSDVGPPRPAPLEGVHVSTVNASSEPMAAVAAPQIDIFAQPPPYTPTMLAQYPQLAGQTGAQGGQTQVRMTGGGPLYPSLGSMQRNNTSPSAPGPSQPPTHNFDNSGFHTGQTYSSKAEEAAAAMSDRRVHFQQVQVQ